jgi:hypothetical protein
VEAGSRRFSAPLCTSHWGLADAASEIDALVRRTVRSSPAVVLANYLFLILHSCCCGILCMRMFRSADIWRSLSFGYPHMHAVLQLAPHTGEYKASIAAVCEAELGSNRRGAPLYTSHWGATEIDAPVRRTVLSWPGAARIVATSATQTLVGTLLFFVFLVTQFCIAKQREQSCPLSSQVAQSN